MLVTAEVAEHRTYRASSNEATPLLELRNISKTFPGVRALDDVSFPIFAGEIHMLCGENGAGKSSLMKVLCGAYVADEGELLHHGEKIEIKSTLDARKFGIAVIFQEFSLVPYLSVAQNIYLGREFPGKIPGTIDRQKIRSEARRVLGMIGSDIDIDAPVHTLGVAQQQIVEIAKALSQDARILVMDEPTSALSDTETEHLFGMMRRLKATGVAIVYISHRMAEVFLLGDRITILRDGRLVATVLPNETSPGDLVQKMVGRKVDAIHRRGADINAGEVALDVKGLTGPSGISDIHLNVRAGEIVGLCGLVGSGRTEVARAVFGADRVTSGEVTFFGKRFTGGPDEATRRGVALIPESRKAQGLALIRSVGDNIVVARIGQNVSVACLPSFEGGQGGADDDREAAHFDAVGAARGSGLVGRQPAEGRHRQVAHRRCAAFHFRRADARHRCWRQGRDFRADVRSRGRRRRHSHDQFRTQRNRQCLRPRLCHARRRHCRRIVARAADRRKYPAARDTP